MQPLPPLPPFFLRAFSFAYLLEILWKNNSGSSGHIDRSFGQEATETVVDDVVNDDPCKRDYVRRYHRDGALSLIVVAVEAAAVAPVLAVAAGIFDAVVVAAVE